MQATAEARIIVTKMERQPEGYYTAHVHLNGAHATVDNRFGSWMALVPRSSLRRDLPYAVAAALQAKLPREERGRR
jgi:hypothetical protein